MAKKKIEERTVDVLRGDNSYNEACDEVKKVSGFDNCLCIRARLLSDRKRVEYEFFVGNDEAALKAAHFDAQMKSERQV